MENKIYRIAEDDDQRRVDRIVRKLLPEMSVSFLYRCLRKGAIRLNGKKIKQDTRVRVGDELFINIPDAGDLAAKKETSRKIPKVETKIQPLILHENKHVLALNKPRGTLVHGERSLEELVSVYLDGRIGDSLVFKPGPAHRLDRNTSGILLFSKSLSGAKELASIFQERQSEKYYLAICDGIIEDNASWEDFLMRDKSKRLSFASEAEEAKQAITKVVPVFKGKRHTLVLLKILTGRTHQIRIQAAIHKHPLSGDAKYRGSAVLPVYILHAVGLKLKGNPRYAGFKSLVAPLPKSSEVTVRNVFNATAIKKAYAMLQRRFGNAWVFPDYSRGA